MKKTSGYLQSIMS